MLNIIITFLTLTIFYLSTLLTIEKTHNEKCLLIGFRQDYDNEIVKYYGNQKNRNNYLLYPISFLDDFSEYDSLKRIFYVDGTFIPTDSIKIFYWEYGYNREITKFPNKNYLSFSYEYNHPQKFHKFQFSIDSIINDSILCFSYNKTRHILKPGEIFRDSIIEFKKDVNRTIKFKTNWTLKNYGLIERRNILDLDKRSERERIEKDEFENEEFEKLIKKE